MLKKYLEWYRSQTIFKQLLISFVVNWVYWFLAWLIVEEFLYEEPLSWGARIFKATWFAFFMTLLNNWSKIKSMYKSRGNKKQDQKDQ